MMTKEKEFGWKGKLTPWYQCIGWDACDKIALGEYRRVLKYLQTKEGLYSLITVANFWAHYD